MAATGVSQSFGAVMRRVEADFVVPSVPSKAHWVLVAVGLVLAGGTWWGADRQADALHAQQAAVLDAPAGLVPLDVRREFFSAGSYLEMAQQSSSKWPLALIALERVRSPDVMVQRIEIANEPTLIRVEIRASSHRAVLEYLSDLNAGNSAEGASEVAWRLEQSESLAAAASNNLAVTAVVSAKLR